MVAVFVLTAASQASATVTSDGTSDVRYGVSSWAYEEEVLAQPAALWWHESLPLLAYLRFDQRSVPDTSFPLYSQTDAYTELYEYRYPKPGFNVSDVRLYVYDAALNATTFIMSSSWTGAWRALS